MRVAVAPESLELPPGSGAELLVTIINDGAESLAPTLTITGVDPLFVTLPDDLEILGPDGIASTIVRIRVPEDSAPGDQRVGVSVSDQDGVQRPAAVTTLLRVGARPDVAVRVDPPTTHGRRSGKLLTQLHNHGEGPVAVAVGALGDGIEVLFLDDRVLLEPEETREVPTRIYPLRPSWFKEVRHGASIEVHGRGAPVTTVATYVQRPLLPPWLLRAVALLTVLALWAAGVAVFQQRVGTEQPERTKAWAASAGLQAYLDAAARGDGGTGDADGPGGAGEDDDIVAGPPIVVEGTVTGPREPVGTQIIIERIGFGDEGTTSGNGETKLAAWTTQAPNPVGAVLGRIETSTSDLGRFRVSSGLEVPAFYRVTALRPGFEIASHIVATSEESREVAVDIALVPAAGAMSGRVTSGGSGLGGADITVTDGQLVYNTTSATDGSTGTWAIDGLAAPATYQVIVSRSGYATETLLVTLDGGEQRSGVDARLRESMGTVQGQTVNGGRGVGAVTVALSGEGLDRATTTLTADQVGGNRLTGRFDFPALPFGTYELTFSAHGFLTQTAEVVVDRGLVVLPESELRRSTGTLRGLVELEVLRGHDCEYPAPEVPRKRQHLRFQPCGNVGVVLIGADQELRTTTITSVTHGQNFVMSGIPPGEYSVRFERYGYDPEFLSVTVEAGDGLRLPADAGGGTGDASTIRLRLTKQVDVRSATITGTIRSATGNAPDFARTRVAIDDLRLETVPTPRGEFTLAGVPPGSHTLRVESTGFDAFTRIVRVPIGETVDVGELVLVPFGSLALRVAGGQASPVGGAEVLVAPDPVVYSGSRQSPEKRIFEAVKTSEVVYKCEKTITLDGSLQTVKGVCAKTDAVGEIEFVRAFPTGNYVFATPVNDTDDAFTKPERRATTVPLDHEQLVRRVDIASGETVRLDPNLRRYPIISGSIRTPATGPDETGLRLVNLSDRDISIERLAEDRRTVVPLPADAPVPRVSASGDPGSKLPPGRYRIDRIPANDANRTYIWRLEIRGEGTVFIRGPGQPAGQEEIEGLAFNEERSISALLLPEPKPIAFRLRYQPVGRTDTEPIAAARVRATGTAQFDILEVDPFFIPIRTTCPGAGCSIPDVFNYQAPPGTPARVVASPPGIWLQTGLDGDPPGTVSIPAFFRSSTLDLELQASGFTLPPADTLRDVSLLDGDGNRIEELEFLLEAQPRRVTGSVQLTPELGSYPPFMAGLVGNPPTDAGIFAHLDVILTREGGSPGQSITPAGNGGFTFDPVAPGYYTITVRSKPDATPLVVERTVAVKVEPGAGAFAAAPVNVDRTGVVRAEVLRGGHADPLPGVELRLERRAVSVIGQSVSALEPYATVPGAVLTTCANPTDTGGGPDCALGRVTFVGLSPAFPSGSGNAYEYRVTAQRSGFIAASQELTPTAALQPYFTTSPEIRLDSYGAVSGTLTGRVADDPATDRRVPEPVVTLVDHATGAPILRDGTPITAEIATHPAAPTVHTFSFPNTLEIPPRTGEVTGSTPAEGERYGLRFEAAGYDDPGLDEAFTFALNTIHADVVAVLAAQPATLYGVVTDADADADPATGLPILVNIELYRYVDDVDGNPVRTRVGDPHPNTADGTYEITGLEARTYEVDFIPLTAEPRPTQTRKVTLEPGGQTELNVGMPAPAGKATGRVVLERWTGGPTMNPQGVTVRAERRPGGGAGRVTREVSTDTTGNFTFTELRAGTWDFTFSSPGFGTRQRLAVVVVNAADLDLGTTTLTAVPTTVTVSVGSSTSAALNSIAVTAMFDPESPPDPVPQPTPAPRATSTNGQVTLTLPPGRWAFVTTGGPALDIRGVGPHKNVVLGDAQRVTVNRGTAAEQPGTVVPTNPTVTLLRYATITGTAGLRPIAEATRVLAGDITVSAPATALAVTPSNDGGVNGAWRVWVPDPTDITITFSRTQYENEPLDVLQSEFVNRAVSGKAITLIAAARDVVIPFTSSANDGVLTGLTATASATFPGIDSPVVVAATVEPGTSNRMAIARFGRLAPGSWRIVTDGVTQRHAAFDETITVPPWDGVAPRELSFQRTLTRLVRIAGTIAARAFPLGPALARPAELTATATLVDAGPSPLAVTLGTQTGTTPVTWELFAPRIGTGHTTRVSFTAPDYTSTAPEFLASNVDVTHPEPVGIVAAPVDVELAVRSADSATGGLNGVTVTAAYQPGGGGGPDFPQPPPAGYVLQDTTVTVGADAGVAGLRLAPGAWVVTTTGAAMATTGSGVTAPHADRSSSVVTVTVAAAPRVELELVQVAEVSGALTPVAFPAGPSLDELADATVTATNGTHVTTGTVEPLGDDGTAKWRVPVPPEARDGWSITWRAGHYRPAVVPIESAAPPDEVPLVAEPRTVPVLVQSDDGEDVEALPGAKVTATYVPDGDDAPPFPDAPPDYYRLEATTDGDGRATLELAPGSWTITAAADEHEDPGTGSAPLTVPFGEDPDEVELTLAPIAPLVSGLVAEVRGSELAALPGVTILAEGDDGSRSTVTTEPDEDGINYRLALEPGTWQLSVVQGGETVLVDEAVVVHSDDPDRRYQRDILLPAERLDLTGVVFDDMGAAVAGAGVRAVSSVGTVTTLSDADGRYQLSGLDNRVTWAVTFSPPDGYDARPVTRYVMLNGEVSADVTLDQTLASGLGAIELAVSGGEPGLALTITLREITPFPTLNEDRQLVRSAVLDGDGGAAVEFDNLVPGDGRSLPQDRFVLDLDVSGHAPVTRSGLDVHPGGTTRVEVDLGMVTVDTREVILTLESGGAPVVDVDVRLVGGAMTLGPPTSAPDRNVYTFTNVGPGVWQVVADGFVPSSITVTGGTGSFAVTLSLVALPEPPGTEGWIESPPPLIPDVDELDEPDSGEVIMHPDVLVEPDPPSTEIEEPEPPRPDWPETDGSEGDGADVTGR